MTCIVGIAKNGRVTMGGDAAGVSGLDITIRSDPKVFTNGEFLIGFTSSFRMGQIIRYVFEPPAITDDDLMAYMVRQFIPALRKVMKDEGYSRIEANEETGGCFLVGVRGQLFDIDQDFQVGIPASGIAAVGCGSHYALGALHVMPASRSDITRVTQALEAADHYSAGVSRPFTVIQKGSK